MTPTSHFLAITLNPQPLNPLFTDLQIYLADHQLQKSLTLPNLDSLHITLYYLDKSLMPSDLAKIKNFLRYARQDFANTSIAIDSLQYFRAGDEYRLAYFAPTSSIDLHQLNRDLSSILHHDSITDNSYPYTPHVSLLSIHGSNIYAAHQSDISNIINSHLPKLKTPNLFAGFHLYQVDSIAHPELQVPLTI